MIHPDRLNAVNPQDVVQAAYAALSGAQSLRPNHIVLGAALFVRALADELGLNVSDLLAKAERIERDADVHYQPEVRALRTFIRNEVKSRI